MALTADEVIIQQTNQSPKRKKSVLYTYQTSFFESYLGGIPSPAKNLPWLTELPRTAFRTLNRRKNQEYLYPHFFKQEGVLHKNVSAAFVTQALNMPIYRRKNVEYRYPSFFMKLNKIPSSLWTCSDTTTEGSWTCS